MAPYTVGVRGPPQRPALEAFLEEKQITYLPQSQYSERYRLTPTGLERVPNAAAQPRLGLAVAEP
jgi:hypothetical protein